VRTSRRQLLQCSIALTLAAASMLWMAPAAVAQDYPSRPVTLIIPWPPGGATDIAMRAIADAAARHLGQPIVIDNKPGGSGAVGPATMAASAKPDGYTISQIPITIFRLPLMQQTSWDPEKDFSYIVHLTGYTFGVTTNVDTPFKKWQDVIDYAKANPGKVTYASTGLGSTNQLGAEFLAAEAGGLKLTHVPYRGGAPAIADVAAGNVDLFFANVSEIMGMARGGKVRVLALASSRPTALAPELPLLTKDIPALDINNWFGLVGPAGLPADIKDSLAKLFLAAMADPANKETLDKQGLIALGQGPQAFAAYIKQDRERWAKVVKQGNIKAE